MQSFTKITNSYGVENYLKREENVIECLRSEKESLYIKGYKASFKFKKVLKSFVLYDFRKFQIQESLKINVKLKMISKMERFKCSII